MKNWVVYGTELEEFNDGTGNVSNIRPLGIEGQVVKDEKGRKRFHGAFTGGFSAGYFNTVGSKEGWIPKKFRSSRDERSDKIDYKPEDFMDEEDLGEFGIAARQIKTSVDVGGDNSDRHLLAWERNMQSSFESSLSVHLQKIIKPIRDSMGLQLLKKMGWREGHGIGSKMSRKALEKQKLNDDRICGKRGFYNEAAVREADEMVPNFLFAPGDFNPTILKSSEGVHGLGYCGICQTSVLSEKYGILESALKIEKKGKGISGQAFGVGAFENDDANIYTNYDFSQYDFAIDSSGTAFDASCSANDTNFIMASKRQISRRFFEPPRIPPNFIPMHTPIYPNISLMPLNIKQFSERMNHLQRAKFLGEIDPKAVFELVCDRDRKKLNIPQIEDVIQNVFEEEPMKQARFKQYINYLKRGLNYPQPLDMTRLEWDQELHDFQNMLPLELRSLIPEVERQQKPLAHPNVAAPIANVLKSKFISSSNSCFGKMKEDERFAAIKMKMFGIKTRSVHEWHPAKQLAKRFNIPDPYPSSSLLGTPHLQKTIKTETLANLGAHILTFELTARDPKYHSNSRSINPEKKEIFKAEEIINEDETNSDQKPSEEFLKAIFGDSDESSTDIEDEELRDSQKAITVPSTSGNFFDYKIGDSKKSAISTKMITVMDMNFPYDKKDDNKEFGPVPPPPTSLSTINLKASIESNKQRKKYHKYSRNKRKREKESNEKKYI
ncbi:G patch domain-containing protein [Dirofilaria immitis]